jgi:hypothetical protein
MRKHLQYWRHRLAHWFHLEPCQLLEVRDEGRLVVLLCTDCGEILHLRPRGPR